MPAEVILEVDASTKYRRVPPTFPRWTGNGLQPFGTSDGDLQAECDQTKGHVLQVQHCGRIICRECGAEWRDEGF